MKISSIVIDSRLPWPGICDEEAPEDDERRGSEQECPGRAPHLRQADIEIADEPQRAAIRIRAQRLRAGVIDEEWQHDGGEEQRG